ncbi:MAG: hypothetical protein GY793_11340 [Proteobacteria bacterium]|nr:hypothetical protein [Pseudomonadota bacterium]
MKKILLISLTLMMVTSCKYYGGTLPPENPVSMDRALDKARNRTYAVDSRGQVIKQSPRPGVERPKYTPEVELALVAPPKALLVWTFDHITENNSREFGSWETIFLTEKYQWLKPINQLPAGR